MSQANQKPNSKFLTNLLPFALLIISVVINVFLALEVVTLKQQTTLVEENQKLVLGEIATVINAVDMENIPQQISALSSKPTLIYVFSPECYWCVKNMESIRFLSDSLIKRYRVVGLSIRNKGLPDFLNESKLSIPIYHTPSAETKLSFNLFSTPQTIVLSESGEVLKIWRGAYSSERKEEIENYFKVSLPNITDGENR